MEDAVVSECAHSQCLRVVLECVRWGFDSFVTYLQFSILFYEREIDEGADAMNTAWGNIACDPEMAHVGFIAHVLEFADGDVVAFVVTGAGKGEIAYGCDDDDCGNDNLDGILVTCIRHGLYFEVRGEGKVYRLDAMTPRLEFCF